MSLRHWQIRTFALLWIGYAGYYLGRVNFAVAQKPIKDEFNFSDTEVGAIPSTYAVSYAVGQFINGHLAERFGARIMMTIAISIAIFTNILFFFIDSYYIMLSLWALNGYAQSAGWSLVVQTMSNWTSVNRRGLVIGLISTCYQVGHVLSWILAGTMTQTYGWRYAFLIPSLILVPIAFSVYAFLRNKPEDVGLSPIKENQETDNIEKAKPVQTLSTKDIIILTLKNRTLWVLGISYFCMNSVRYAFMNWAVQYMSEFHGSNIDTSAFKATALPLIGAFGAVTSGFLSDALFGGRRAPLCSIMLMGLAFVCYTFVKIPQGNEILGAGMLGLAGFLIYGPDMLMSGAATVDIHPRASAAATGFTMSMGAFGAIFSGIGVGALRDHFQQWDYVFFTLSGLSVVSSLMMATIWNAKPRK